MTPGPWTYSVPTQTNLEDWGTVRAPDGYVVTRLSTGRYFDDLGKHRQQGTDPTAADANLIAAAPDLLAACESALDQFGAMARDVDTNPWCKELEAAIKKARGEAC